MTYTKQQEIALVVLRLIIAATFIYAGVLKFGFWSGVPQGFEMSAGMLALMKLLSVVEPLGGVAVLIGFLTRWAGAGLSIIMVGAILLTQFMLHVGFATQTGAGWNYPLAILAGTLILATFGAGSWSVDAKRGIR